MGKSEIVSEVRMRYKVRNMKWVSLKVNLIVDTTVSRVPLTRCARSPRKGVDLSSPAKVRGSRFFETSSSLRFVPSYGICL